MSSPSATEGPLVVGSIRLDDGERDSDVCMDRPQGLPGRDPGWGEAAKRTLPAMIFPFLVLRSRRESADMNALTALRAVFLSMLGAQLVIVVLVWLIMKDESESSSSAGLFAAGVAVAGLVALGAIRYFAARPLEAVDASGVAGSYRTAFFLKIAFAQMPLMLGFVGSFVTDAWWVVFVGLPFSLAGFAMAAPTSGNLAREQARLRSQGSSLDLVDALVTAQPQGETR